MKIDTLDVTVETITPETAKVYFDTRDTLNRGVRSRIVGRYAEAMKAGQWELSTQGIVFDKHGRLIDGQHRMSAIIKAGVSVKMMVCRGASESLKPVLDSGSARTPGDRAVIGGIIPQGRQKKTVAIMTVIRDMLHSANVREPAHVSDPITTAEMKKIMAVFGEDIVRVIERFGSSEYNALLCTAFVLAGPLDRAGADVLAEQVRSSVGIEEGSGAHHLVTAIKTCRGRKHTKQSDDRLLLCLRFIRCIEMALAKEKRERVVIHEGVAVLDRILARRRALGLCSSLAEAGIEKAAA